MPTRRPSSAPNCWPTSSPENIPDARGRFGPFGGRYVPETLFAAFERLDAGISSTCTAAEFQAELAQRAQELGGPSDRADHAPRAVEGAGARRSGSSARISRTPARTRSTTRSARRCSRKRLGAQRVVAETGAGQHGVASAAACARVGLPCTVYMGEVDMERQAPNVGRMRLLGATVVPVTSGDRTLRAAIDEAMRDWVSDPHRHVLHARLGGRPASVSRISCASCRR